MTTNTKLLQSGMSQKVADSATKVIMRDRMSRVCEELLLSLEYKGMVEHLNLHSGDDDFSVGERLYIRKQMDEHRLRIASFAHVNDITDELIDEFQQSLNE